MNILIVGIGSIGRRHLKLLQSIGDISLGVLRSGKGSFRLDSNGLLEFHSLADALSFKPDGVIICSPTELHIEHALPFLEKGCRVLIEKPLAGTSKGIEILSEYSDQFRVAYCQRFSPLHEYLRTLFSSECPFKIGFKRSYYLPNWHPAADYRTEYTAQKKLGGGVTRTLSHEIDLSLHWFGSPQKIKGYVSRVSPLEIDVDDNAHIAWKSPKGAFVSIDVDFLSPTNVNTGEAFTKEGHYRWNNSVIEFCSYTNTEYEINAQFRSDDTMYHLQIDDFISFIKTGVSLNACYEDACDVLRLIETVDDDLA